MRISTQRVLLTAPPVETWAALLDGQFEDAVEDYPTEGDLVMARLVVEGHLPAGEWGPWQVIECATGLLVGSVGFKGAPDAAGVVEIAYVLAPSARGRGMATEAVRAVVLHARARGALAVRAEVETGHAASERVLTRAGFTVVEHDPPITWWWRDLR